MPETSLKPRSDQPEINPGRGENLSNQTDRLTKLLNQYLAGRSQLPAELDNYTTGVFDGIRVGLGLETNIYANRPDQTDYENFAQLTNRNDPDWRNLFDLIVATVGLYRETFQPRLTVLLGNAAETSYDPVSNSIQSQDLIAAYNRFQQQCDYPAAELK